LNNLHLAPRSGAPSISHRIQVVLLTVAILLTVFPWDGTHAQAGSVVDQAQVQVPSPDQPDQRREESHELTPFFLIGIMINIVALSLFAIWAAREWKKKKPGHRTGDK